MVKDRTQKTALEMTFQEFHSWSVSHVIFEIGEGNTLRNTLFTVLDQAARSKQFGNNKRNEVDKDRTEKNCTEMTFSEFHSWSVSYLLFEIGEGNSLRDALHLILSQLAQNEVFGVGPGYQESKK